MRYKFLDEPKKYDGSQLKSLFGYLTANVQGDSIISFVGPCDIPFKNMVDGEDFLAGSEIRGSKMLHFIIEKFPGNLELAVAYQRLFACLVFEYLAAEKKSISLRREGDDIFIGEGKLSISIATVSPISSLIHFAVNISNSGTPVRTSSLEDLDLDPKTFSDEMAKRFVNEINGVQDATTKVHWVP